MPTTPTRRHPHRVAFGVPALCLIAFCWLLAYTTEHFLGGTAVRLRLYFHRKFEQLGQWINRPRA